MAVVMKVQYSSAERGLNLFGATTLILRAVSSLAFLIILTLIFSASLAVLALATRQHAHGIGKTRVALHTTLCGLLGLPRPEGSSPQPAIRVRRICSFRMASRSPLLSL